MPACSVCGVDNPPGKKFCPSCGAALAAAPPAPRSVSVEPTTIPCRVCAQPAAPGVKFCRSCGNAIGAVTTPAAEAAAVAVEEPPVRPPVIEDSIPASTDVPSSSSAWKLIVGSLAAVVIFGFGGFLLVRNRQAVAPRPVTSNLPAPAAPVVAEPPAAQPVTAQAAPVQEPIAAPAAETEPQGAAAPAPILTRAPTSTPPQARASLKAAAPASFEAAPANEGPPTRTPAQVQEEPAAAAVPPPSAAPPPSPRLEPPPQNPPLLPPSEPAPYRGPLNGTLTYSGPPVVEQGEVVFRNLPPMRLALTYDQDVWEARLSPAEGNTQRLILRNKKPGTQKKCTVAWRVVQ
jgi:hypothetical protein